MRLSSVPGLLAITASIVALTSATAHAETQPAPGLTMNDAVIAFGDAVLDCMQAVNSGNSITSLGDTAAIQVQPLTDADRKWVSHSTPKSTPTWVTRQLGFLMIITETSPQRCEVEAQRLPVDRTFKTVLAGFKETFPDYKPVPVKPGYSPIVYQLESINDGARYVVHMEGAEPGGFGHLSRFSLLVAWVEKIPLAAKNTRKADGPTDP